MKRTLILSLLLALAAGNILSNPDNSDEPAGTATDEGDKKALAEEKKKDPTGDDGVKKLSRRERKERLKNLTERYQQFLKEVEPIILPAELNTFLLLESDAQRDRYIEEFWRRRDPDPKTAYNEYSETYKELVEEARAKFKNLTSDRGKMYLVRGRPDEIIISGHCDRLIQPIQVWKYAHIPGIGRSVSFVFFIPRNWVDYKLWTPMGSASDYDELLSSEGSRGVPPQSAEAVIKQVWMECRDGDQIMRALQWVRANKFNLLRVFEPPKVQEEDINRILRSSVISDPNAPKLETQFSVKFPGKRGARTSSEMTLLVARKDLTPKEVNGMQFFNLDVTGEVLKDGKLFETYRYRYDFPLEGSAEILPLVIERFLRPAEYQSRVRLVDINSGAEAIIETPLQVPYLAESTEKTVQEKEGSATVQMLQEEYRSGESRLRIVPLPEDLLTGHQQIETIVSGSEIAAVEFYLDGKKVMIKRSPPYTLGLDLGNMPRIRKIRVVGLSDSGQIVTGDEVVVNAGVDPFRVRIVTPRVTGNIRGKVRVEIEAKVPDGKVLENIELYLNDAKLATLYTPPFIQTIQVPENLGIGYIRAVAALKDDPASSVEDLVFINTPEYMQEVDVHLVELPTSVLNNGKHVLDLPQTAFKVLDEGKPVQVSKFEYVKNLPLSIGMAIDASGSMKDRMAEAQKAGGQFFRNVLKPGDKGFVVAFDKEPSMVQKWTRTLSDLNAGLASVRAEESTALYDAIVYSLYNFQGMKGQKALVVISDGKDTTSKFAFDQALEYSRRAAVPIYIIAIGVRPTEMDTRYKMAKFSAETGGNLYYIDKASDLTKIYDDIETELRSQYLIGFYPPGDVKSGSKWREVSVTVDRGKAKTIRGYYP